MIALSIIFLVGLLLVSAFLASSETALFSLSTMKLKAFKREEDSRKQLVARLLAKPRDLLVTLLMLNISVNILVQNTVASLFGDFSTYALNVGLPLALTLIFGDVIPKSVGLANNAKISYRAAPFLDRMQRLLLPFRKVLVGLTSSVSRLLFFFLRKEEEISLDELRHALHASRKTGLLHEEEAELIRGYLNLEDTLVKELMRPREEVIYFDIDDPLSKLVHLFVDQECTRIPVCKGAIDEVIGVITSRQFFLHQRELHDAKDLSKVLKKPFFIPESTAAKALLEQMYGREESIALVVDEFGSISGLIALEDLIEVVVGQIADRRDEKSRYSMSGEDVVITSGKFELTEFFELFGVTLPSKAQMVTIGGWLTEQLGDIPKSGAKYVAEGFLFHVLSSEPTRVRRVYIRRMQGP